MVKNGNHFFGVGIKKKKEKMRGKKTEVLHLVPKSLTDTGYLFRDFINI